MSIFFFVCFFISFLLLSFLSRYCNNHRLESTKKKKEEEDGGGGGGGGGRREGRGGLSRYCWCGCVIVLDWLTSKWDRLLHGWHDDGGFGVRHVALAPHLGHSLQLSVEVDALWEWSKWRQLLLARMGDLHGAIVKKKTKPDPTKLTALP